jgi:hypothetical protein
MHRLFALLLCVAAAASACSSTTVDPSGGCTPSGTATTPSLASGRDGSVTAEDVESLRRHLFDESEEPGDERHARHEQIITECMAEEVFEYVALPYPGMTKVLELKQSLSAEDFAHQYGYGGATLYEEDEIESAMINASLVNPNDSIREAMSSSELAAYYEAFKGPPQPGAQSEDGSYQPADPQAGCHGRAGLDVYGGPHRSELSSEARLAIEGIERAVQSNGEVQAARADWSQCMSERGYELRSSEDIYALLDSWLRPVLATGATKTVKVSGLDGEPITVTVPAPDPAELTKVGQLEIALAVADVECDASSGLSVATAEAREAAQLRVVTDWYDQLVAASG